MSKTDVPTDFKRFVLGIEQNDHVYIKLAFSSSDELNNCSHYYFERAILRPDIAQRFAEYAAKVYFVAPENEDINLRKSLIVESQKQIEVLVEKMHSASNPMTVERATGITAFFGELYNVGFIFKGIVKKYLEIFDFSKSECLLSNRCYYCLLATVKNRVLALAEEDYGIVIQSLVKRIEDADRNPPAIPESNKTADAPRTFEEAFPPLNNFSREANGSSQMSFDDKVALFKFILDDLTATNAQEVLKKLNENKNIKFDEETWEAFYELLIEHGISNPKLAEAVVDLCQRIPRGRADAWQGMKVDDCKIFIIQLINLKIKAFFDKQTTQVEVYGVLNVLQKFMVNSYYSIGSIATTIDVILSCAQQSPLLVSNVLLQLFMITKKYVNTKKIQKLPDKVRQQVMHAIKTGQKGKLSTKGQHAVKEIEEYIGVETGELLNESGSSEISNFNSNFFEPVASRMATEVRTDRSMR